MRGSFGGSTATRQSDQIQALKIALGVVLIFCLALISFVVFTFESSTAKARIDIVKVPAEIDTVRILVPVQTIKPGTKLTPSMFRFSERPNMGLPARVIRDTEEVRGQYARYLIAEDIPLVSDYITAVEPTNPLSVQIPAGYRAVTIRVNAESVVGGWAVPGSHVDVLWTTARRGDTFVIPLIENTKVLSSDQGLTAESQITNGTRATVPATVTLLVSAADTHKIALTRTQGTVSLVLRGDGDPKSSGVGETSMKELFQSAANKGSIPGDSGTVTIGDRSFRVTKQGRLVPASN